MKKNSFLRYFSLGETVLWSCSMLTIIISFCIFDRSNYLVLAASLVGVTSLIFCAKGNPFGQFLMVAFSILYGVISYRSAYYGEMITYLGLTMPMAIFAFISWIKNPYNGNKSMVKVNKIKPFEIYMMFVVSLAITFGSFFLLIYLKTENIVFSTISVFTSLLAVYLSLRRSPFYALGYAANDIVLIILWVMAAVKDPTYIAVSVCFLAFLINDLYGFFAWRKMQDFQK